LASASVTLSDSASGCWWGDFNPKIEIMMRPQQNRRMRGRSNNNNNNNRNRMPNPLTRNYESNGPDVRIRGNAQHIADKYTTLARDAQASGDRIMAENYLQHAEHYVRIILSAQPQMVQNLRDEMPREEMHGDNVVELTSNLPNAAEAETDSLQLGVDENVPEIDASVTESDDTALEAKPKTERPRRIVRRRLPRQITEGVENTTESAETAETQEVEALPVRRTRVVKRVIAAVDSSADIADAPQLAATTLEDSVEKPRRRRRVLKAEDDAVQEAS